MNSRPASGRMNRRPAAQELETKTPEDEVLNFRVQEKGFNDPDSLNRRSRLGNIFKDASSIKESAAETLKRPLTGLFRRPGTRSGKRKEEEDDRDTSQPPSNFRGVSKLSSTLEDVFLNDDSPGTLDDHDGLGSTRTMIGADAISKAPSGGANLNSVIGENGVSSQLSHLGNVGSVDISVLTRIFQPDQYETEDEPWNFDHLFVSLHSESRDKWAANNEAPLSGRL